MTRTTELYDAHDNVTWQISKRNNPTPEAIEARFAQAHDAEVEAAFTHWAEHDECCAREVQLPDGFLYGLELE